MDVPGLQAIETINPDAPTVHLLMGSMPSWFLESQECTQAPLYSSKYKEGENPALVVWKFNSGKHFYLRYADGTSFIVDTQGTQIWADWPDDLTVEDTATYLLGPVLGFVLRLQGVTCLHASAVVLQNRVVVFMGEAGAGKSTTAAAFAQRGYPVLSDDVVALVEANDRFMVQPAYPRIRLWQESVIALYGKPNALPRIVPTHPDWDKRYLDLTQPGYQFQTKPISLGAIYYLKERNNSLCYPRIEAMPVQERLMTLVANTYTNYLLDKNMRVKEFEVLGRLNANVPIRQVISHTDIVRLPQFLNVILSDFNQHALTTHINCS
uniref:HPr kinase n=1 Tax=Cyanothece sp. (strain PCC 7425 / ATCC 29141) TaxID=395961 RepID=B8HXX2_CYAP4